MTSNLQALGSTSFRSVSPARQAASPRRHAALMALLMLGCAGAAGCSYSPAQEIRVADEQGFPVENVQIALSFWQVRHGTVPPYHTRTRADGSAKLPPQPDPPRSLVLSHEGFGRFAIPYDPLRERETIELTLHDTGVKPSVRGVHRKAIKHLAVDAFNLPPEGISRRSVVIAPEKEPTQMQRRISAILAEQRAWRRRTLSQGGRSAFDATARSGSPTAHGRTAGSSAPERGPASLAVELIDAEPVPIPPASSNSLRELEAALDHAGRGPKVEPMVSVPVAPAK